MVYSIGSGIECTYIFNDFPLKSDWKCEVLRFYEICDFPLDFDWKFVILLLLHFPLEFD